MFSFLSEKFEQVFDFVKGIEKITDDSMTKILNLVKCAEKLVPHASSIKDWTRRPGGIRSQLINLDTGVLEQDFIVESSALETHVLNAVSPGWTSAIPFAKWICEKFVSQHIAI